MEILSTESLFKLKKTIKEDKKILEKPFDELKNELELSFVQRYEFDESIQLELPISSNTVELSKDIENCFLIKKALPHITPADATDERLWVTLCIGKFKDYLMKRWGDSSNINIYRIFASGFRGRMSINAVGRLWWSMHIANTLDNQNPERFLNILFLNQDYRQQLLERTSSANSKVVLKSILEITEKMIERGKKLDRNKFRNIIKQVSFLGKRTFLPSMDEGQLKEIMRPLFEKSYN